MPAKRKCDYRQVYLFTKEWGKKAAIEEFRISPGLLRNIVAIGDAILENKTPEKDAKTLDKYSPRELMQELAKRGYEGKLAYTYKQIIDIQNF